MRRHLLLTLSTGIWLASCATTPDPAVVCSADWITPRAQSAMKDIKRDTSRTLKSLSKTATQLQDGGKLSAFQTYRMVNSVTGLMKKFETSQGLKDLKTLASTCDEPHLVKDSFMSLLAEYEAPQALIDMFEGFESLYRSQNPSPDPSQAPA